MSYSLSISNPDPDSGGESQQQPASVPIDVKPQRKKPYLPQDVFQQECGNCARCKQCRRFGKGDRVELSPSGLLVLGGGGPRWGSVVGQHKERDKALMLQVHWDGFPAGMVAQVLPIYAQKIYGWNRELV